MSADRSMILIELPQSALPRVFESNSIGQGMTHDAPGGARLELGQMPMGKRGGLTHDALPMATVLLTLGGSVAINLFSSWLYDKLKSSGVTTILINREEIEVTSEKIRRVIESIHIEQRK